MSFKIKKSNAPLRNVSFRKSFQFLKKLDVVVVATQQGV